MRNAAVPADRDGFRVFFEAHRGAIHRLLCRLARDAHHADDLLQETFLTVWRKRDQFRGDGSVEGWMRVIAVRTYLNARPRLVRNAPHAGGESEAVGRDGSSDVDVGGRIDRDALLRIVRDAVDALPEGWREPFVLFRYEGVPCAEVAALMGLTPKAVELRLARALKAVAEAVRGDVVPRARLAASDR